MNPKIIQALLQVAFTLPCLLAVVEAAQQETRQPGAAGFTKRPIELADY